MSLEKIQILLTSKSLDAAQASTANEFFKSTEEKIDEMEEYPFFVKERMVRDGITELFSRYFI